MWTWSRHRHPQVKYVNTMWTVCEITSGAEVGEPKAMEIYVNVYQIKISDMWYASAPCLSENQLWVVNWGPYGMLLLWLCVVLRAQETDGLSLSMIHNYVDRVSRGEWILRWMGENVTCLSVCHKTSARKRSIEFDSINFIKSVLLCQCCVQSRIPTPSWIMKLFFFLTIYLWFFNFTGFSK